MIYIKVIATTGSKKESISEIKPNYFEISVKEKPERNMANTRIVQMIASHFKVPVKKVRIVNGHHHPHKLLVVDALL
jgi:uncharacterized protein YggU (UPF0235/DUF167 family)